MSVPEIPWGSIEILQNAYACKATIDLCQRNYLDAGAVGPRNRVCEIYCSLPRSIPCLVACFKEAGHFVILTPDFDRRSQTLFRISGLIGNSLYLHSLTSPYITARRPGKLNLKNVVQE